MIKIALWILILTWAFHEVRIVYVNSNSMNPYIYAGDIVITKRSSSYAYGDVVTFQTAMGPLLTHRIASEGNSFLTKGDANNELDSLFVTPDDIIGKVIQVIPTHAIISSTTFKRR